MMMSVSLDHPLVADYLQRLDGAAAALPVDRRVELVDEIRGHVRDALSAVGDDDASVRGVLDRLGDPRDIVAAESESIPVAPQPVSSWGAAPGASPMPSPQPMGPMAMAPRSPWGALEIVAVLGLTLGGFIIPFVGPIIGWICALASPAWTRREKTVATFWVVMLPVLLVLVLLSFTLVARTETTVGGM